MDCHHFGTCGGCRSEAGSRPLPYTQELRQKEDRVRHLLSPYDVENWHPMVASPEEWYYRNKMEYAFAVWDEHLVLGQRETGRFDRVVDLETCFLMSADSLEVLKRVRHWAKKTGLSGYHRGRHQGDLRYLVIREGKNTGERMAILLASREVDVAPLAETIRPVLTTAWLGVTGAISDVARADDMRLLWGPGTITEKLNSRTYQISPYSFFQTNTRGTEKLYSLLQNWGASFRGALVDLYCGSGGITLAPSESFDRVVGLDTNAGAIEDAKKNAQATRIGNAEFVCEDAMEFLKKLPGSKLSIQLSAMVVDPPRAGLHPKALKALVDMNPPRLAYVSCNPESL